MYLLKHPFSVCPVSSVQDLHSTMYLLKHCDIIGLPFFLIFTFHYVSIKTYCFICKSFNCKTFTFHYVSIKTWNSCDTQQTFCYLHSTMYLLKPELAVLNGATEEHLHSTMYLLKQFRYKLPTDLHNDLHSTMYLLKPVL